jgi:hypothetical protein
MPELTEAAVIEPIDALLALIEPKVHIRNGIDGTWLASTTSTS